MATSGGFGLVYKIKITGTLTLIPKVQEGSTLPKRDLTRAEITGHDSAGGYKEQKASGKRELGDFDVVVAWDSANAVHQALLTAFKGTALVDMSVTKVGGSETIAVPCHVYKLKVETDLENVTLITFTCKPSGAPTVT